MSIQPAKLGAHRAPALISFPEREEPRSVVIVLHGGGLAFDKRWALDWLPLDGLPVLRAYVDLPLHGDRMVSDMRERFRNQRLSGFFGPAILGMAVEIPSIIDDLLHLAADPSIEKVGLCGWSIGGLAAFLAALGEERIGALAGFAVPGGGTRYLRLTEGPRPPEESALLDQLDLLRRASALYPKPVLLMHGTADTWVGAESSRTLHDRLKPVYADSPDRLRYVEFADVPHDPLACRIETRKAISAEVRGWLEAHLLGDGAQ